MFRVVRSVINRMSSKERRHFYLLLVLRSLTAILDIVGVLLVGVIGATAAGTLTSSTSVPTVILGIYVADIAQPKNLLPLAGLTLGFFVVKAVASVILTRRFTVFVAGVEHRAATRLVEGILYGGLTKVQRWSPAELTHGVTIALNAAYGRLLTYFATLVTEGFLLLCIAVVLAIVNPLTMLVVVLYFGILGLIIQFYVGRKQQVAGAALGVATVEATTSLGETIGAFREIFTLGKQSFFIERFRVPRAAMADNAAIVHYVQALPRYIVESALLLGAVALIASQSLSNNLSGAAATLTIFLTAGFRITASLLPLQNAAGSIGQVSSEAAVALGLIADYENIPSRRAPAQQVAPNSAEGMQVELHGVQFHYDDSSRPALADIDFVAKPGEYCAIIGASGAGKSTLADLLLGLIEPSMGTIELDGLTPRQIDVARPGSIAYVPQRPGLISGSIAQNVALGFDDADIDAARVEQSLRQANLLDHVNSLPEGADTSVGKQSNALSGGQIQRLGLARALYAQPRLLVLDEATSALDAESESVVGDSLRELGGSVTLVVIAHRLSTVQHADTVHVMENGRIIASGPFAHLLETVPLVARYAELMSLDEPKP